MHARKRHERAFQYGFCIAKHEQVLGHRGGVPGFNTYLGYQSETRDVVIVMTNLSNNKDGTMPAEELGTLVMQRSKM